MTLSRLAVLVSGEGTNLQVLLDQAQSGKIPAKIALVISDRKKARALERSRNAGVEALWISPKSYSSREDYDVELVKTLRERKIDWVILAGFMRILSPVFVQAFPARILNIHPALLPAYPGLHAIERAFQAGEKKIGVTVHFVDEGVDTGPIVLQDAVSVKPNETLEALTARVHALEHRLYPQAICKVLNRDIKDLRADLK